MARLIIQPNLPDVDAAYTRFIDMIGSDDMDENLRLCARLILILANHIGDPQVIEDAVVLAKGKPAA